MNKILCSVPILTLNSGKYLEKCLLSLTDFTDVYILDGNSIDNTLLIAKKFNIPVYKQYETEEKCVVIKNFTEIRNKSISLSKFDWILDIDSDEYLSEELIKEIKFNIEGKYNNFKIAYNIKKICIIKNKIILHSFNYPSYYLRLYNKKSGIEFDKNKLVHEKMIILDDVKIINLNNFIYSYSSESFKQSIEKDNYYLKLVKNKISSSKGKFSLGFKAIFTNILKAAYILFKSLLIYFKHGYKNSLPISEVVRYMRYHFIVSYLRSKQLYNYLLGNKK